MGEILIVDDDPQLRQSFSKLLTQEGYGVRMAPSGEAGLEMVRGSMPDLVIMDVRLPGMTGLQAFQGMHAFDPKLPVIIMTAYGTTETAIEATKMGAFDYVLKPFDIPDILDLIRQALDAGRLMRSRVEVNAAPEAIASEAILGQSKPMQEIYKAIGRVARADATVLVRGESGTGKELVARSIYQHSLRANKPFLIINCVAIPETLLESELFGYEKGAFTGAVNRRVGKIEQAYGGTIFLDEIGDMPFSIQAKILRLLQEKSIERLGGREPIPVDVRIIAATNRDLEAALAENRFREDLYYRLKVVTISLPPLRERQTDIPMLADYFIARFAREMDIPNPGITHEAKAALMAHHWPGNVRELGNALHKALIFSRGRPIGQEDVTQTICDDNSVSRSADDAAAEECMRQWVRKAFSSDSSDNMFDLMMDRFASVLLSEALSLTGGNRSRAAKLLGISRPTLLSKIEKLRLKMETSVSTDES
ncbi:MAG: sigma-54-dependent transcriptional regulator [Syntrophobacteraceae bacterium]